MEELVEQEIPVEEVAEVEESTPSEEVEQEVTSAEEPEQEQPKSGIQKRINELTRQKYDAERRATQAEERLHEVYKKPQVETPTSESMPKEDDFNTYEEYIDARARFSAREELRSEQSRMAAERKTKQENETKQSFAQKVESLKMKGSQKHADFFDITQSMILTEDSLKTALESDIGDDIIYYLAGNAEEAQRIAGLSTYGQAMEIGKIEAKMKQPIKKTTNAPDPITPVGPSGVDKNVDLYDSKTDDDLWAQEFNKRRRQRRGF